MPHCSTSHSCSQSGADGRMPLQSPRRMLSPRTLYCMRAVVMVAVAMAVAETEAEMAAEEKLREAGKVAAMVVAEREVEAEAVGRTHRRRRHCLSARTVRSPHSGQCLGRTREEG